MFKQSKRPLTLQRKQTRRRGFTMVELLLVLVILGTLAAIVVPKFSGRSEQAKVTAAKAEINSLELAIDSFEIDNGRYPIDLFELQELPSGLTNWRGPYLKQQIDLDPWEHPYIYQVPGQFNPSGYDIMAMGLDGAVGGDDDVVNWKIATR